MIEQQKFWDMVANRHDKTEERLKQLYIKVLKNTKKHLSINDTVLDFGCGTGTVAVDISGNVKEIHGIDISSKMIDIAKKKVKERGIDNVHFVQTTIFDDRYKKESFDVILAFGMLHFFEDGRQIVQRIIDLLKPGGLFISSTPCLGEKMTFLTRVQFYPYLLLSKTGLIVQYLKRFNFSEVEDLITVRGLRIIETEIMFHRLSGYFAVAKKI